MSCATVIIAMGNDLLSDDGVGIVVAREVHRSMADKGAVLCELPTGGIRLMEAMVGFQRAVVIDACVTGALPGTITAFAPQQLLTSKNSYSSHDTDFCTAFSMGELLGIPLPRQVRFWGIEADDHSRFSTQLTPAVAAAVPTAVAAIVAQLEQEGEQ